MTPYVFVALVLCGIAVAAAYAPKLPDWRIACLAIVLIFGAFRFQTGYDWLVYEDYYRETEAIVGGRNFEYTVEMEPLFHWLNVAFVYLGLPACVLLIAVTVFNLVVLDRVTGRISRCHPLLWTVYFGMLFIPVQMSAMRQALASSFILMGLLALTYRPAGAVSVASLSLLLSGPASQPLIPYVNWLEVYLFPWEDYDAMQREKVYRWMEDFSRMQDEAAR